MSSCRRPGKSWLRRFFVCLGGLKIQVAPQEPCAACAGGCLQEHDDTQALPGQLEVVLTVLTLCILAIEKQQERKPERGMQDTFSKLPPDTLSRRKGHGGM
jgi:hypothetical protein